MDQQVYLFYFQQCIALDDFSDAHSYYWAVGLLELWTFGCIFVYAVSARLSEGPIVRRPDSPKTQ
jgi:hypothetical protein